MQGYQGSPLLHDLQPRRERQRPRRRWSRRWQPTTNLVWFWQSGRTEPTCAHSFQAVQNWNYCFLHGGDVDDAHRSETCRRPGPMHNRYATHANMMGGSAAGMHKSILPSSAGHTASTTTQRPHQQQATFHRPPVAHMSTQGPAPPPVYYTGPAGGAYCQRTAMAFPAQVPGQVINFVGQYPPRTGTVPMMLVTRRN
jgi:hypothetical protein